MKEEENKEKKKKKDYKEIRWLIKKNKKLWKEYTSICNFEQPVIWLIRRTGEVEFIEGHKKPEFVFEHSDGTQRAIPLTPKSIKKFNIGRDMFKGYILHEDHAMPLPEDPIVLSEEFNLRIDKAMSDHIKYLAMKERATGFKIGQWGKIALYFFGGIALIITAILLFGKGKTLMDIIGIKQGAEIAKTAAENATKIVAKI